jgi:hypothetical protein
MMSDYQDMLRGQVLREEAEQRARREMAARVADSYQDKLQQQVLREEVEKWRRYEQEAASALQKMGEPWDQASRQHAKELRRKAKEAAKAAREAEKEITRQQVAEEKDAARRQVEDFDRQIARLISEHKAAPPNIDWETLHFSLPPHPPAFHSTHHLAETAQTILVTHDYENLEERLATAWSKDEQVFRDRHQTYADSHTSWSRRKVLATRLRAGEAAALVDVLTELSTASLLFSGDNQVVLQPHDARRVYAAVRVNGRDIIPEETQALTQSGKVTSKNMPRNKALELYEDHVCSRCLAVARRLFAVLPVREAIVTAYASTVSSTTGNETDLPIVSAHFDRERTAALDFERLDPSDALQSFRHTGDVRASRRGEQFKAVQPLAFADGPLPDTPAQGLEQIREAIAHLRTSLAIIQPKTSRQASRAEPTPETNS